MRTLFRYILGTAAILLVIVVLVIIVTVLTVAVLVETVVLWGRERLMQPVDSQQQWE